MKRRDVFQLVISFRIVHVQSHREGLVAKHDIQIGRPEWLRKAQPATLPTDRRGGIEEACAARAENFHQVVEARVTCAMWVHALQDVHRAEATEVWAVLNPLLHLILAHAIEVCSPVWVWCKAQAWMPGGLPPLKTTQLDIQKVHRAKPREE